MMPRWAGGVSFKLFWVGLAQLVVVLVSIVVIGALVARRAARWDVPAVMARVEHVGGQTREIKQVLAEMRAAGGPPVAVYDSTRRLIASNVDPPLALPGVTLDPPGPGARRPSSRRPDGPPGVGERFQHVLLGRPGPPGAQRIVALHVPLESGMGVLVLDRGRQLLGFWLTALIALASVTAVGLGAYLTGRFIVRPLVKVEKELVANVAHELRTPLSRIRVALDIAGEGDAATARASLDDINLDLAELEALIDDVLTAARLELGASRARLPLNLQSMPCATLIGESVARFRIRHPAHRVELASDASLPTLAADPVLLRRALDNLLDNAAKYSPDTSRPIVLEVRRDGDRLCLEIRDSGVGISRRDLGRVFSPFFRVERSRARAAGGVGLGLTLARQVVEAHGGRIRLDSTPGAGTTARIELPVRA